MDCLNLVEGTFRIRNNEPLYDFINSLEPESGQLL